MTGRWLRLTVTAGTLLAGALLGSVWWLNVRGDSVEARTASPSTAATAAQRVARGAYLARAGNCAGCHTARGGAAYAGGAGIATPFGTVYASNLTPDRATGIGDWSADDFWRALHNGRSRGGRLLYPVFPYPNTTHITRDDSDALHAFLQARPPVQQANREHRLRFPYDTQAALAVWRALYFKPGVFEPRAERSSEWNRGAYLVRGLGHCEACHASRNVLGASSGGLELGGGVIPLQNWYAPSLAKSTEAGAADLPLSSVVTLLRTGTSPQGSVLGPMAEVVWRSLQYLDPDDLRAIAVFLQALPQDTTPPPVPAPAGAAVMAQGRRIYEKLCVRMPWRAGSGRRRCLPASGRQPQRDDAGLDQRRARHRRGRLCPCHRGQPPALRHAALRRVAGPIGDCSGGQLYPQRLRQPSGAGIGTGRDPAALKRSWLERARTPGGS